MPKTRFFLTFFGTCFGQPIISFHPEEETPGNVFVKSKLSPLSGSLALRQLSLIYKKGP